MAGITNYLVLDETHSGSERWRVTIVSKKWLFRHTSTEDYSNLEEAKQATPDIYIRHGGNIQELRIDKITHVQRYIRATHPTQQSQIDWEREIDGE